MIEVRNLNKYYYRGTKREIHVINDTTLHFDKTGFVCILGESGSGKTTFLNTISGLDSYDSGYIRVDDVEMNKYSVKKTDKIRQENCGYIFQNYYLLNNRTVYENVEIVLDGFRLSKEEKKERIFYVLSQVGLLRYRNKQVKDLSGGEQQRVSIARALVKSPKVIFADEPTGSLDEKNTIQVLNILKKLSKKYLIIMVTHEVSLVEYYADTIIRIDNGIIISNEANKSADNNTGARTPMDRNVYLKEFESSEVEDKNNIKLNLYYNEALNKELVINVAVVNNKVYVEALGEGVEVLNDNSEIKLINDYAKEYNDNAFDNFEYNLESIEQNKLNHLNFRRIVRYSIDNIRNSRKKNIFLYIILVVLAFLSLVALEDIVNISTIDYENVVLTSYGNIYVKVKPEFVASKNEAEYGFDVVYDKAKAIADKYDASLYMVNNNNTLLFAYDKFEQTNEISGYLKEFDYKFIDFLDPKDIVYGRMPEADNEVVIDIWVLDRLLVNYPILANVIDGPKGFLNEVFKTSVAMGNQGMKIVGICRSESPTIYIDKFFGIRLMTFGMNIGSLEYLQKTEPETYGTYTLRDGEVLANRSIYEGQTTYTNLIDSRDKYDIIDYVDTVYDIIISEESYPRFVKSIARYSDSTFVIMAQDGGANIEKELNQELALVGNISKIENKEYKVTVENSYQMAADAYHEEAVEKVKTRLILTVSIFIFSIAVIYFAMRSSAIRQIGDIAVYRSLGFSKFSLVLMYVIELAFITSFTSLISVIVGTIVFRTIDSIPSIDYRFFTQTWEIVLLVLFLYLFNITIGILPIIGIMRLTPAKIYAKYDM